MTARRRGFPLRLAALLALAAPLGACEHVGTAAPLGLGDAQALALKAGTDYGMCAGYCTTELTVDGTTATLAETSRQGLPARSRSLTLTGAEAARLRGLVDASVIAGLKGVHGCPDCADGGSEWIQIQAAGAPARVTFERNRPPQPIAPLQAELEALRSRLR